MENNCIRACFAGSYLRGAEFAFPGVGVAKKIKSVSVPTKCWKVIYIKQTNTYKAYIFNNDTSKPDGMENNEVTVADVEKLTGFKFK